MKYRALTLHTICSLLFSIFFGVQAVAQDETDHRNLRPALEHYLERMADSGFAFSALVAIDDTIILHNAYGWIDSSKTKHTTEQTLFNIASITKSFTATAIVLLRDKYLLSLDDSLPSFFNNVPHDKRSITITQLLTHTSGLPQNYRADGITDRDSAVHHILSDTLQFPPGTRFSYSNENFELLGAIMEIVLHQPYEEAVRTLILSKANMTGTRFWAETTGLEEYSIASMNRRLDHAVLVRNWGYIASGGMYSTAGDLYRWFSALSDGAILSHASLDEMWTARIRSSETGIASGWFVSSSATSGREIWTRGTEDWGHNAVLRWFPDRKVLIIVLTNSGERGDKQTTANRFISDGLAKIIFE